MKKCTLVLCLVGLISLLNGQDTLTIQQIQTVSQADLLACVDSSQYLGDTVWTTGVVTMDGQVPDPNSPGTQVANAQAAGGNNTWIQSGTGPFSGIDIFQDNSVPGTVIGTPITDLVAGDSIFVRGIVARFGRETELLPLEINLVGLGTVQSTPISVGDLNDDMQVNVLETGEQWEGSYVEINNVTVTGLNTFGNRVTFFVSDSLGNTIEIADRFLVQRKAPDGTFTDPTEGEKYETIRGVVAHNPNGCATADCPFSNPAFCRGYIIYPFLESDYVKAAGASAPDILSVSRNPITPESTEDVTVTATVEDIDGNVVSATLFYAVGVSNNTFTQVAMSGSGTTWTGTIPNTAYSDGDFVKYYVCATDNDTLTACRPNINANQNPVFFAVRDDGTTIFDVQFTPYDDGNSGYRGLEVTLKGIVTASAQSNDLGFVYIQQPDQNAWAGLSLVQNAQLATLNRGDEVEVRGTIEENFGLTRMTNIITVNTLSTGNPLPAAVDQNPDSFTDYDFMLTEPYECMLVRLANPSGGSIFVSDNNADDQFNPNTNFAEYRVGTDPFDGNVGCRVAAGRSDANNFSSLWVSYINDSSWITNDGLIDTNSVAICIVQTGDTVHSVTGIMYYSFGDMKLYPRNNDDYESFAGACGSNVGIEDELKGSQLRVFPNPASAGWNLEYQFTLPVQAQVELLDLTGRSLKRLDLQGHHGKEYISANGLAVGTYLLSIQVEGQPVFYQKVVLIH